MGGATQTIVEVAAVVVAVVAPEILPVIGDAILEAVPALAETGISSSTLGSAAIGAGSAGFNTAVAGGNVEQILISAAEGGVAGGVGAEVGSAVGGAPEQAGPFVDSAGTVVPPPGGTGVTGATDSVAAGNIAKGTAGGFGAGFTKAELSGQNLQRSLRAGEIGGLTGGLTAGVGELLYAGGVPAEDTRGLSKIAGIAAGPTIASLFAPDTQAPPKSSRQTVAGGLPTTGTRTVGAGPGGGSTRYVPGVGSAALGQALGVGGASSGTGSTGGYGAGGESLSPETGGKQQTVWNIESLRVKPEES